MAISRRSALRLGAAGLAAPMVLRARDALASSGRVRVLARPGLIQPNIAGAFERATGIALELAACGSEAEVVRRARGGGFDVACATIGGPTGGRDGSGDGLFAPLPAAVDAGGALPGFLGGGRRGARGLVPFAWGTEGVTLSRSATGLGDGGVSYGDLWRGWPAWRPASALIGLGLHLDATGAVPSDRLGDAGRSADEARRVWGGVARWILARKQAHGALWSGSAGGEMAAFLDGGSVIGQTGDTDGLLLNRLDPDLVYRAPREGLIASLDGVGMLRRAANRAQAAAFIGFMLEPATGAMVANNTGRNPVAAGAAAAAGTEYRRQFAEVYTAAALAGLWWPPAETPAAAAVRRGVVRLVARAARDAVPGRTC